MQLNQEQKLAVQNDEKYALVIAGAGSGKTRTLIERIAYLVEHCKVSPYEILALTFTRKAAQEMKERLAERIGNQAYKATIGTLHSFALRTIKRFGSIAGYENPTVYGDWEEKMIIDHIARELGLKNKKSWTKVKKEDVNNYFAQKYNGQVPEDDRQCESIWKGVQRLCAENNALTYGGLLLQLDELVPKIRQELPFKHILVDECQDLDAKQWSIIFNLQGCTNLSIFAVGDLDQSIYEWRGAIPKYMLSLSQRFTTYYLAKNHRSDPEIVSKANRLIENNQDRLPKTMVPVREETTGSIMLHANMDSAFLADEIKELCVDTDPNNIAVLARNHVLLNKVAQYLDTTEVPYTYIGQKSQLVRSELFQRFHAFLRLLVNPHDNFSFLLIKDLIGITDEDYVTIRKTAASEGKSHFQVHLEDSVASCPFAAFFRSESSSVLSVATFGIKYMATGAYPYPSEGWGWSTDEVSEVFVFVFSWIAENPQGTIEEYLEWLATYDLQDEHDSENPGVTLSTIHGVKGLEWPVVVVAGCNEGLLPSKQAIKKDDIEAERRLTYVAWTRAQHALHLTIRPERQESGNKVYHNPSSRFIDESFKPLELEVSEHAK